MPQRVFYKVQTIHTTSVGVGAPTTRSNYKLCVILSVARSAESNPQGDFPLFVSS